VRGWPGQSFYQRRYKYGGMGVNEAKRLKGLEEESRRLKKIVADRALDLSALKEALRPGKPVENAFLRLSLGEK
jgi:putative transposase